MKKESSLFDFLLGLLVALALVGITTLYFINLKPTVVVYRCAEFEYQAPYRDYCQPGKFLFFGEVVNFTWKKYEEQHPQDKFWLVSQGSTVPDQSIYVLSASEQPDPEFFRVE